MFFQSLGIQLILFYTIISSIVISIGCYFSWVYSVDLIKKYNEKSLLEQFSQSDYNIQSMMNEVDRLSMMFTIDNNVQDLLQENYNNDQFEIVMNSKNVLNTISDYLTNYSYLNSIYIYMANGGEIGTNNLTTICSANGNLKALLKSDVYFETKKADPKFYWHGGNKVSYFAPETKGDDDKNLITAFRLVKPNYQPNKNALLVFNIDERYLASLYGNYDEKDEYTYITDKNGIIISSIDGKGIGTKSSAVENLGQTSKYGSYTSWVPNNPTQIVYYKMSSTGWFLVRDIPYATFEEDATALQRTIQVVFGLSMLVIIVVSAFWLKKMTSPLKTLAGKMADIGSGNLGITFTKIPNNEFSVVIRRFNEMSVNIKNLVQKNNQIEAEKRNLEIEALQYQINPHFLYNTLNMIKWMAVMIHAKNIEECIIALGNIIRPVYQSKDSECTIGEEIDYINNYLKIMNWRYGNLIRFSTDIAENVQECRILRFILQPIIENCLIHGITDDNPIEVQIHIFQADGILHISVSDNGAGISVEKLTKINECLFCPTIQTDGTKHIGLLNVSRRMFLNYEEAYSMYLESKEGKGTTVFLGMPAVLKRPENISESDK